MLEVCDVTKRFGTMVAVDRARLDVAEGEMVCLLGPSGCGKTTLLRMIAGLEDASEGDIVFDGRSMAAVPAHERGFGMVFQSLALFPHLSVGENIAYPLAIRGAARAERRARVAELLEMIQLPGIERRAVSKLSGGQRQRVAIARALAVAPKLFLLDEPLSALDAKLREAMQVELKRLQQHLGVTTIVVTHDQREAMTLADTIVVMREGRIQQVGAPMDVYRRPANAFVADFIGQANFIRVEAREGGAGVAGLALPGLALAGPRALVSVRPEDLVLAPDGAGVPARVVFRRDMGASVELSLESEAGALVATHAVADGMPAVGDAVMVRFDAEKAVVLPDEAAA